MESRVHDLSVIVPVYRAEATLRALVEQLSQLNAPTSTPNGTLFRVVEVLLVYDWGPDDSDVVMRQLELEYDLVTCVWLMRNSGQHAATAAGIASSGASWVATIDEDGQHDPRELAQLLDAALASGAHLVYGVNRGGTPHPWWRNATSAVAKRVARVVCGSSLDMFTSFRLIEGTRARAACAYLGSRTFLDTALTWTANSSITVPVQPGVEGREGSGYRLMSQLSHFWTLVLSSGTRPLRIISLSGLVAALAGVVAATFIVYRKLQHGYDTQGWASVFVAVVIMGGAILFSIGVVAEYVGATLRTAQGRPAFVIGDDPKTGQVTEV